MNFYPLDLRNAVGYCSSGYPGSHFEVISSIDDSWTIIADSNRSASEGPRCRPFEIQTRLEEPATVAWRH